MIEEALIWGLLSTIPLVVGAWIAFYFRPSSKWVGIIMGFGAGALIAAVAYELIPESSPRDLTSYLALGVGALVFYLASSMIDKRSRSKGKGEGNEKAVMGKSIVLGAMLDGVPESIVLGMSISAGNSEGLAFLGAVFVSNLPESISATSEMDKGGMPHRQIYGMWLVVLAVCVAFTVIGALVVQYVPSIEGIYVKAFAAGAVLAMLADSMIPEGFEEGGKPTGLMVVMGFAFASVLSLL